MTSDVWFLDVWGVMHNGETPFTSSIIACQSFRERGGYVLLLTNSPRSSFAVTAQLDLMGIPRTAYDNLVTSGDVTRNIIRDWDENIIYHLGPERNREIFQDLEISFGTPLTSNRIVCTGLLNDIEDTPEDYMTILKTFLNRDVKMLCVNPDLRVERGRTIVHCAGAIAKTYEDLGGEVIYSGKPFAPIYELALLKVTRDFNKEFAKERILAIGDGVFTDIRGASAFGIRSVFIASGIHVDRTKPIDFKTLSKLFETSLNGQPVAVMSELRW
ncbi:MAG: hypothetical protein TECD_00219 [Hyphomicrobiaceae bacterium hypho_1]